MGGGLEWVIQTYSPSIHQEKPDETHSFGENENG